MKKTKTLMCLLALLCICIAATTYAQQKTTSDPVKKLQQKYNSFGAKHEVTFDQFLKMNSKTMSVQANGFYDGCDQTNSVNGNGDFEKGLDTAEWQGAFGTWAGGDPDPGQLTEGFISGDLYDFNAHQTIVSTGIDPTVGISMTNSQNSSSKQALRLGNAVNNYGTEMISKTFTVVRGQTIIPFFYATVFEDPQHDSLDQPWFSVRVFDCATGQELTGVCNLGNGLNRAVSNRNNPFFKCSSTFGCNVVYRDWTRAQIDLSNYIGKKVNIQLLNKDCGLGGHYGYTYIDDWGSNKIDSNFFIIRDVKQTDTCGKGQICVDYVNAKDTANNVTGETTIDLDIYQSGKLVKTLHSGLQTQDSGTFCFSIDPLTIGVDTSLGAFDYTITGNFSISGFGLGSQTIGNPPDGQVLGFNNDYFVTTCPNPTNQAPMFVYPPTPKDSVTINAHPGDNVAFTVQAKDDDAGDNVTLTVFGLPNGATTTPVLPASGNPASTKFAWTPGAGDAGTYPVTFIAKDNSGATAATTVIVQITSTTCDTSFKPWVYVYPLFTVPNQAYHTIYMGYGQQYVDLLARPRGGMSGPFGYKFKWDDGSTSPLRRVWPTTTTTYYVDITNKKGCTARAAVTIYVVDVRCGSNNDKVQVCLGKNSLCVNPSQVNALIKGGAKLGSCNMTPLTAPLASSRMVAPAEASKTIQSGTFTAYPSPARSEVRFRWDVSVSSNAKINIMDLQGRVLITQTFTNASQSINISKLTDGVYVAQLMINGRQAGMTRFTVSK